MRERSGRRSDCIQALAARYLSDPLSTLLTKLSGVAKVLHQVR